ncbi:MAG: ATP-dependent endonuclease [Candidatus Electrothrix sp. AS4_5]|nr:ATP-dependent endonuclease [Candidatus Electrothrix gigas]
MYISKIKIINFRNFVEREIEFTKGINVIIGHNNSGKTNLLRALSLVLDFQLSKRLVIDDFNKGLELEELKKTPPKVSIEITIKGKHDYENPNDDLVTVSNWLTVLEAEFEALLTYEFFLPEKEKSEKKYTECLKEAKDLKQAWKIIEHDFLRFYKPKIWGGKIENRASADVESLQKFDFQSLDAIRDVERDMFSGKKTLLRDVMSYFLDYEETDEKKKENRNKFAEIVDPVVKNLHDRLGKGKEQIQIYSKSTGASYHNKAKPEFEGKILEQDVFSALKLIIRYETGIDIPVSHNGLGYNNLIFMSLLLAKMQADTSKEYMSTNAKVFSILCIEEPEAHLHPSMQYKFLKFLDDTKKKDKVRQIFVTSHSTHITSAVKLDDIICLHNERDETLVGYPGKAFPLKDTKKSKKYVQRFLDATKSDMLFAQKILLVEGISEQLLVPILVKYANLELKKEFNDQQKENKSREEYQSKLLEDNHIAVIAVGGRYFDHFLHLFDQIENCNSIPKKVACLTDRDPERKRRNLKGEKFNKCYPFEYNQSGEEYEYQNNATPLINKYDNHPNIRYFSQDEKFGKTFEYELVLYNPSSQILVTDGMSNKKEIKSLMSLDSTKTVNDYLETLKKGTVDNKHTKNKRIIDAIKKLGSEWNEENKKKSVVASRYLNSVGKGENALDLAVALEDNYDKNDTEEFQNFDVPKYIKDAIVWLCKE